MSKFYSKTTGGFYDADIHAELPPDAVPVTDAAYTALFQAQAAGQVITADVNGNPQATNPPAPTTAALWLDHQYLAKNALADADVTMNRITEAVALGLTTFTAADVVAFVNYRRSLRVIVSASSGDPTLALPAKPPYPSGT